MSAASQTPETVTTTVDIPASVAAENSQVVEQLSLIPGYIVNLLWAIIILAAGYWLAKAISGLIRRLLAKRSVEVTIVDFIGNLIYGFLLVIVLLTAADRVGLPTTSLITVVGASTLAVGMALRDSLANFAAGVLLVSFRYYRVRDRVEVAGASGTVKSIHIFFTELISDQNDRTIVPNGNIIKAPIKNLTSNPTRRMEIVVKVGYKTDVAMVKALFLDVLARDTGALETPQPTVELRSFTGDVLEFVIRAWVSNKNYGQVLTRLNEKLKMRLDEEGVVVK